MKLVIRADATPEMGTGHVMRCIALAQAAVRRGMQVTFATRCEIPFLRERLSAIPCTVAYLEPQADRDEEMAVLRAMMTPSPCAVVLDGYHFTRDYQQAIRPYARTVVLDDHALRREFCCDILVNPSTMPELVRYPEAPDTRLLVGHRYVMLREEFLQALPARPGEHSGPVRLLVSMGGADPHNATCTILQTLAELSLDNVVLTVLTGPANPHTESIRIALRAVRCAQAQLLTAVSDMPALLRQTDLAISAAGSTCFELARMGIPFFLLRTADNQALLAESLTRQGIAVSMGSLDAMSPQWPAALSDFLADSALRHNTAARARSLVDGLGAFRLLEALAPTELRLRPATPDDCDAVFSIANDPQVRAASFNPDPIPHANHVAWYKETLKSADIHFYMAENACGVPAGYARFHRGEGRTATISVAVAQPFRGCGLGGSLIGQACRMFLKERPGYTVRALIKSDNIASVKSFLSAGFYLSKTGQYMNVPTEFYTLGAAGNDQ